jgi:predicted transposase/invertase (TIGR01784 family)
MLGNLDNEIIFKKAFTDKIVFKAFVRDILGIEIEVDKIETEKQFKPKIGNIDFKLDIFAESVDKRVIIEIQRVEYDRSGGRHNFDRFLHYFLMAITEQQRRSKEYGINQTVYLIVVLTAPYKILEKNGRPILDEVLLLKLNPRTLKDEERELFGHQFVCLNPNHPEKDTPKPIRDWLDLIYQSIYNSGRPVINLQNEGIKRAAELIEIDNISPEELELKKKTEAGKVAKTIYENAAREEGIEIGIEEGIVSVSKNALRAGMSEETVSQITGLPIDQIKKIKAEMN